MSGRILQFEAHRHGEAMRLLPWLVNGRLDDAERAWLDPHVAGCSECRQEVDALRELQAGYADADEQGSTAADADRGWRRLQERMQSSMPASPAAGHVHGARRPRWQRWALVAQAAVIGALAIALWQQHPAPAAYRTLGAAPASSPGNLVIVFDPHLDEGRLRNLLLASQARIVDGPNEAGAYVIAVPPARLPMVRDALRAAPGVTLVAALGPGSTQ